MSSNAKLDMFLKGKAGQTLELSCLAAIVTLLRKEERLWVENLSFTIQTLNVLEFDEELYLFVTTQDKFVYVLGETRQRREEVVARLRLLIGKQKYVTSDHVWYWFLVGMYARLDPAWEFKYAPHIDYLCVVHENHKTHVANHEINTGLYLAQKLELMPVLELMKDSKQIEFREGNVLFDQWFATAGLENAKAVFFVNNEPYWCRRVAQKKSHNLLTVLNREARYVVLDQLDEMKRRAGAAREYVVHHPILFKWIIAKFCDKYEIERESQFVRYHSEFRQFHSEICNKVPCRFISDEEHRKFHSWLTTREKLLDRAPDFVFYLSSDKEYFG